MEKKRAMLEVAAVVATGLLHLVFENLLHLKSVFIAAAFIGWGAYLLRSAWREPARWRAWGFRRDTLSGAALWAGAVGVPAAAAMIVYGLRAGHLPPPPSFWLILALYPVWGLLQQFLLNSLLASNLRTLLPAGAVVPLAAALFAIAHAPDPTLMALTFLAGCLWVPLFLRHPNLWVFGTWHGILGALAYYAVLGRDPVAFLLKGIGG
jgi:hypothetical protein